MEPATSHHYPQQGAVLIIVLLITALITALTVRFTHDFQLTMARAAQRLHGGQGQQYLLGAESFAQWNLAADAKADRDQGNTAYDHLGEDWATTTISAPVDGGWTEAKLQDAQGKFNLNQLHGQPQPYRADGRLSERFTPAQRRFIRLLQTDSDNPIDSGEAIAITEAVIDWIDADDNVTGADGAESDFYAGRTAPHRAANQRFVSATELRLIRGITAELYRYLAPWVIALPDNSGININTASAPLMRTLNSKNNPEPLGEDDAQLLMNGRPTGAAISTRSAREPEIGVGAQLSSLSTPSSTDGALTGGDKEAFNNISDFSNSEGFQTVFGRDPARWPDLEGLTTGSDYFLLSAQARVVNQYRRRISLLKRVRKNSVVDTKVIRRSHNQL